MISKRIFLSFLLVGLTQKILIPLTNHTVENSIQSKTAITWAQVCSCRSYQGVPHTCYYSPVSDPDYSCVSKCVREANQ